MCGEKGWYKYLRGSIWWVEFKKNLMSEHDIIGLHPALIISDNDINAKEHTVLVMPLSSQDRYNQYKDTYQVHKITLDRDSYVQVNFPRKIETKYLKNFVCLLNENILDEILEKFKQYIGLSVSTDKVKSMFDNKIKFEFTLDNDNNPFKPLSPNVSANDYFDMSKNSIMLTNADTSINTKPATNSMNEFVDKVKEAKTKTKSKKSKTQHRKNKFSYGYWKDIDNNIECWNDKLTQSREYCMQKYKLTYKEQWTKLTYRVRQFLYEHGLTDEQLKNTITREMCKN